MRTQRRNQQLIYLCQKYLDGSLVKYKEPIPIYEHCHGIDTNSDTLLTPIGIEDVQKLIIRSDNRVCIDGKWQDRKDVYHTGDRVYVYKKPPEKYDDFCKNADYEVESLPYPTPNQVEIILINRSANNNW